VIDLYKNYPTFWIG